MLKKILKKNKDPLSSEERNEIIEKSSKQVGPGVFYSTIIVVTSFLPVFLLTGMEGKLFHPLAWTKTFILLIDAVLAITLTPVLISFFLKGRLKPENANPITRTLERIYTPILRLCLKWRKTTIGINIVANNSATGFSNTADTIIVATANSKWQIGDRLYYSVPTGNTPIAPLTGNAFYYISFANTTTIKLATTATGANIDITDARVTATGEVHTIRGDTATGLLEPSGAKLAGVPHAGWVLRTVGTGGRAGRIQTETLVAMGSMVSDASDPSDDTVLPDA